MEQVRIEVKTWLRDEFGNYINYESSKIIDHNNSSDRKWMMNHIHWAMRNSRTVALRPII